MEIKFKIANFWTRIVASLLDVLLLGIFGMLLGLVFGQLFLSLGKYGYLVGLFISVLYFSILNSNIFKGQTIGKIALNIQVVDENGELINFKKSLIRSFILIISYFAVNQSIPFIQDGYIITLIQTLVFSVLIFGIILLYIFNNQSRQSIHDLVVGSYVISKEQKEISSILPKISKSSIHITGIVLILLAGSTIYGMSVWNKKFSSMNTLRESLSRVDGIADVGVSKNKTTYFGKQDSTISRYSLSLRVNGIPDISKIEKLDIVKESIKKLIEFEPEYDKFDLVSIGLIKGWDIGIAKQSSSYFVTKTPGEWKDLIK